MNEDEDEEQRLLYETIAAGRGERDAVGVRDEWSSTVHLGAKYDVYKKPMSANVRELLDHYRLECHNCHHHQAVAKINAFVRRQKQQGWWVAVAAVLVTVGLAYYYKRKFDASGGTNNNGTATTAAVIMEKQRRRAAAQVEESSSSSQTAVRHQKAKEAPPTWRDNEEKEVWTPKQEKQFAKALVSFGAIPAKARYILIADKVDGKSRQECLMHHKLLQAIAKEQ